MNEPFRRAVLSLVPVGCLAFMTAAPLPGEEESSGPHPALELVRSDRLLMIAHRGYSGAAPENTLPAFEVAARSGADLVELDYFHSRDGVPVVFHDRTLDRTTDAVAKWGGENIPVESKTLAELRELDAGSWFGAPAFAGAGIPTLREAVELIQQGSVTLVERKQGDAATCVELLEELGVLREVVVQAFDWSYLRDCRALAPDLVLGALGPPRSRGGRRLREDERWLDDGFLDEIADFGAQIVVWNRLVTAESVRNAQERGFRVWVYTVNDPDLAIELVDFGVDGIITDFPTRIWRGLALRDEGS